MANIYNNFFDPDIWETVNSDNKDLLDDFLLELKQNRKSDGTIKQYFADLRGILTYIAKNLENKNILELNKRDFRKYSLYLTTECDVSSARHNRLLSSLRSMLTYAEENDEDYDYDVNVAKKVRGLPKESVREIVFLTNEQIEKLKNKLIENKEFQKATILCLAYDSCARKNELNQVEKFSFYDHTKNSTNKVVGKRRKIFPLLYFDWTKYCAKLWLDQRGEDNIDSMWIIEDSKGNRKPATNDHIYEWFVSMRDLLYEIEHNEINFNVHSLRHSSLQNLSDGSHYICEQLGMKSGFPIEKLKIFANHSDLSTTSSYLKDASIDELEEMFNIQINE